MHAALRRVRGEEVTTQAAYFPAETAAVPVAFSALQQQVANRDVIAFVDNEAAVACLIRGTSRTEDSARLAELLHVLLLRLSCRLWIEWMTAAQIHLMG